MKALVIALVITLVIVGLGKCCSGLSKKMYDDCMAAGDKSHDTCYTYSYLQ